eukprot:COSAG01_NODE_6022_length_3896_cov_3.470371_3_plen_148_part_00
MDATADSSAMDVCPGSPPPGGSPSSELAHHGTPPGASELMQLANSPVPQQTDNRVRGYIVLTKGQLFTGSAEDINRGLTFDKFPGLQDQLNFVTESPVTGGSTNAPSNIWDSLQFRQEKFTYGINFAVIFYGGSGSFFYKDSGRRKM